MPRGSTAEQLSEVRNPDDPLVDVAEEVAQRWPVLEGARWFAPIADGFSSNLGIGADDETTAGLAAATSGAVRVLLSDHPRRRSPRACGATASTPAGRCWAARSTTSAGSSAGWKTPCSWATTDPDELMAADPDPTTPLVLPYLSGERSTGWAAAARAVIVGASSSTSGGRLFRASMEGVALSYQRIADQLRTTAANPERIVASGRVTQDLPRWLQVLADVLGTPVEAVTIKRTTLRGTALHALEVLAPDTARAPLDTAETCNPWPSAAATTASGPSATTASTARSSPHPTRADHALSPPASPARRGALAVR